MSDNEVKLVPYLIYSESRAHGTPYACIYVQYRESVEEPGTFRKTSDQQTLQDIMFKGFVSDFGEKEFIGWEAPRYTGYEPYTVDLERAAKLMRTMARKLDKLRDQYGQSTFGTLAAHLAAAYGCKVMLTYNCGFNGQTFAPSRIAEVIDSRIATLRGIKSAA